MDAPLAKSKSLDTAPMKPMTARQLVVRSVHIVTVYLLAYSTIDTHRERLLNLFLSGLLVGSMTPFYFLLKPLKSIIRTLFEILCFGQNTLKRLDGLVDTSNISLLGLRVPLRVNVCVVRRIQDF